MMLILYRSKICWGHKIMDTPNRGTVTIRFIKSISAQDTYPITDVRYAVEPALGTPDSLRCTKSFLGAIYTGCTVYLTP